ncbi:MAG TPA: AAA family ATPase [Streptomyces sp.]|uniref:HelD family protein n=1 Tax=Streptomyces sp. TaxID=1931 RepID=UPI002D6CB763|nr:AAA family ATPase [Streptomyces sp.]HZG06590.1 AAA family ATPase [Streptomyces sp.]
MTPLDHELDRELDGERTYHEACRAAMAGMVEGAAERVVTGEDVSASGADAEVLGYRLRSHARELRELPDAPLFFGRLDFQDSDAAGEHRGQRYHIGRRRITTDPSAPPLVVDWRAPVSRAFYRASARDPQGVAVRRRFGWAPGSRGDSADLTGLEDEHLGPGSPGSEGGGDGTGDGTGGSAILAAEIGRPRVGPMRDIVATIQPEQDDLVRRDLADSVCVQGAPGTGKTAVGLHRAAYLLYTHPQRLQRGGLLVLGPNRAFLRYISEVLPSLGETGVRQSTIDDEIARWPVRSVDEEEAAVVKHDARMATVLHRALYGRIAAPSGPVAVPDGSYRWRIPADELARIVEEVRAEAPPYAVGRERVRTRAVAVLQRQAERRAGPPTNEWLRRTGRSRAVTAFVDEVWPKVRPEEVVASLLTDPDVLAAAADGVLTAGEQKAVLWRRPPRSWKSARWSAADLLLLDEVAGLLERPRGYGHVVVDEAQDLSPMQCRAIARRIGFGSVTVLGDLAQGTTPWAARDWSEQLAHLGRPQAAVVPLTTGFRVPAAIVELANRLVGALGVDVPPARSLRYDGELAIRRVSDLRAATVGAVRAALAHEGSVGVIADAPEVPRLHAALTAAGVPAAVLDEPGASGGPGAPDGPDAPDPAAARVTVLPAALAKGLEYDHVIAVEPAAIAGAEARGLHRLYVVLTRAVSRLDVLHHRPLPPELAA